MSQKDQITAPDTTTSCRDCVFATKVGVTQTGCELNRIDKFRERGTNVIEAEDLDDNEFFVIYEWCNAYREQDWKDTHGDPIKQIKKELSVKLGYIVIITNKNSDREDFKKTIDSIIAVGNPHYVVVANWSDVSHPEVVINTKFLLDDLEVDYQAVNIHEDEITNLEIIDHAFVYVKNGFYSVIESGQEVKPDIQDTLSRAINDEFKTVAFVDGYDGVNGLTVQAVIHKHLFGNYEKSLKEKIEGISKEEGTKVLYSWEELENDTT